MNRGRVSRPSPSAQSRSRSRSIVRKGSAASMKNKTHDEHGNMIDHAPIDAFIKTLDSIHKDEWRARTLAFEALIETLPGSGSAPTYSTSSGIMPWYKSYTALRKLSDPISSLLLNARSTVVKHATQHLAFLVQSVKDANPPHSDMCKYLLKDLVPAVLTMHAQTVKLIKGYALEVMGIMIPLCRFKSGLPVLLERLRKDRSRDVREACVVYLRMIVKHWSGDDDIASDQVYLTNNICTHIGNGLARALMDPAQNVRTEARNAFELYRHKYPDLWNEIVQKPGGILSKDSRLKKSIMAVAIKADKEGANIEDFYPSYEEGEDYDTRTLGSAGSRNSINSWKSNSSFMSKNSQRSQSNKTGFRAANRSTSRTRNNRATRSSNGPLPPASKRAQGPFGNLASTDKNLTKKSTSNGTLNRKPVAQSPASEPTAPDNAENNPPSPPDSVDSFPKVITAVETKPTENYLISNALVSAHKEHIDVLMESLRAEMTTVRDFESLLVQSQSRPDEDGTYGPSEDDVLKYYETVYSFLDKGTENASKLRKEMERISATNSI